MLPRYRGAVGDYKNTRCGIVPWIFADAAESQLAPFAMAVDDLDQTAAKLKEGGARLVGEGGPQVFAHPKSTHGVLIQLSSRP